MEITEEEIRAAIERIKANETPWNPTPILLSEADYNALPEEFKKSCKPTVLIPLKEL